MMTRSKYVDKVEAFYERILEWYPSKGALARYNGKLVQVLYIAANGLTLISCGTQRPNDPWRKAPATAIRKGAPPNAAATWVYTYELTPPERVLL